MKTFYIIVISTCLLITGFSQDFYKVDSLRRVLFTTQNDTIKGLVIAALADEYLWVKLDTTLYYSNIGLQLIKEPKTKNKFQLSENFVLRSFEIRMYEKIAIAHAVQRNDSLALKIVYKALQMAEKSTDKMDVPRVYGELGDVYSEIGEPVMAINYYKKALLLDATLPEYIRNENMAIIGESFYELGNYDSALYYINKVYDYFHS